MPKTVKNPDAIAFLNAAYDGDNVVFDKKTPKKSKPHKDPRWMEAARNAGWIPPREFHCAMGVAANPGVKIDDIKRAIRKAQQAAIDATGDPLVLVYFSPIEEYTAAEARADREDAEASRRRDPPPADAPDQSQ